MAGTEAFVVTAYCSLLEVEKGDSPVNCHDIQFGSATQNGAALGKPSMTCSWLWTE